MAYVFDSEPTAISFSNDSEPSSEGVIAIGNPIGLLLTLTYSSAISGYDFDSEPNSINYVFDSEPS